ncbi:MAG: aldo/keto reductase, partial [Rhodospirillales bacterium]|nr:aldo/keto reductase [Rhodospirillales bacterium]
MKYRRLGRTDLEVSEIVFGAGWVGGVLIHHDAEVGRSALRLAREAGVNWIDTAPSYGDGISERALGELLPELDWNPYLSTKFHVDPASDRPVSEQIEESVGRSLARLNRTSVDLLQLH